MRKLLAFLKRDLRTEVSYRFSFFSSSFRFVPRLLPIISLPVSSVTRRSQNSLPMAVTTLPLSSLVLLSVTTSIPRSMRSLAPYAIPS